MGVGFFGKLFSKGSKVSPTITAIKPGTNLTKKRNVQDQITQSTSKIVEGLGDQGKINVRTKNPLSKFKQKISNLVDEKAKGGRVGLKRGGGLMSKKSNIQKIKETFGPRQSQAKNLKTVDKKKNPGLAKLPIEVRNKMGYAAKGGRAMLKKGSKFPDLNKDGKITKADILMGRGVIKKKKFGGGKK